MAKITFVSFVFLTFSIFDTGLCNLTCLVCDSVALPKLCRSIVRCGPHEVCGLETFVTPIGSVRFRQRCLDKRVCYSNKRDIELLGEENKRSVNSIICMACCDSNLCNSGGCGQKEMNKRSVNSIICMACCDSDMCNSGGRGQKGFADDADVGNLCYNCDTQIGANTCNEIQACSRDQVCQITPKQMIGAPANLFETKCAHESECFGASLVGRKRSGCSTCCNGTLCNDYNPTDPKCAAASAHTTTATTTIVASSSPSPGATAGTTTTSAVVTTQAPTVTTTTQATTTTTRATTTRSHVTSGGNHGSADCKDTNGCFDYMCKSTDPATQKYVHDYCKFTCGLCGTSTTDGPDLACKDVAGCTAQACRDSPDWAHKNCPIACGTCVVHASAKEGYGWYLSMKATAGVPHPYPSIYELWAKNISINTDTRAAYKDYTATFQGPFKPAFTLNWDAWHYDMVNVSMYVNGTEKAFITFNATGLDNLSWFRADRVIASSWDRQPATGDFKMSNTAATGFEFNAGSAGSSSAGCASSGWLTVVTNGNCVQDSRLRAPAFLYCQPGHQPCTWRDKTYQMAEVFAIHAHSADDY